MGSLRGSLRACWLLGSVVYCGCSGEKAQFVPKYDPAAAARQALADYDADHDGAIAGAELASCPGLKSGLAGIDTDHDQWLSEAEIAARVAKYLADNVGLTSLLCRVTLDGKPLADAEVTLIPEKFMGATFKPAKGKTDESGQCSFQIDGEPYPGIQCGIFRVQVSRKDAGGTEALPARYNANTELGADVSVDNQTMLEGLILQLKSK